MPKTKTDYSKTVIYKIVCNDLNVKDIYVGSTIDFTRRKSNHKNQSAYVNGKQYNYKLYQFIRNNGGWDNWSMIEIEKFPCNDKREAETRERYYYELLNANLNTQTPCRTKQEWVKQNKDKIKEYYEVNKDKIKEYYEVNKDKILLRLNEKFDCICGGKYSYCHKQRHCKSKKHQDYLASVN